MSQAEMANKLRAGFVVLAGRSAFMKVMQIFSSLTLAYKLVPADYGSFGIIYGFVSSLIFLTDIGLGDLLIQKKEAIEKNELSSYIGIRLLLGLGCMVFFAAIYPFILSYYKIDFPYSRYVVILALILPMEAFIGAAIVKIQKDLHFKDFAKVELYESVVLYVVQISLAFLNFGIWSLFIAIFFSRLLKTFYCLRIMSFSIWPRLDFSFFKGRYLNGFYFQLNSILPTSKAMLLPVILALSLDIHAIGIIFWITSLVSLPLVLAQNYNSVLFPALSKFQDDHEAARKMASHSMEKMILVLALLFGLGGVAGDKIIALVFNSNWADAKQVIFVCAVYHLIYSIRYMCYPVLYVKNLASKRTIGELLLVLAEYLCVYLFCKQFGIQGYFISLIGINLLSFYYFYHHSKDWLSLTTFTRFHLVLAGILLSQIIEKKMNIPEKSIFGLVSSVLTFSLIFTCFLLAFDVKFREILSNVFKKMKKAEAVL